MDLLFDEICEHLKCDSSLALPHESQDELRARDEPNFEFWDRLDV